jgi:hypothetical protein
VANLDNLIRWQEFRPDLGENRNLARPFYVELAVGLTKPDLQRLAEALDTLSKTEVTEGADPVAHNEARAEKLAGALGEWVRMGPESLTVNGEAIDTLPKLLKLYARVSAGSVAMLELATALRWFNSTGGTTQLFFERLSGGSVSTEQASRAAR